MKYNYVQFTAQLVWVGERAHYWHLYSSSLSNYILCYCSHYKLLMVDKFWGVLEKRLWSKNAPRFASQLCCCAESDHPKFIMVLFIYLIFFFWKRNKGRRLQRYHPWMMVQTLTMTLSWYGVRAAQSSHLRCSESVWSPAFGLRWWINSSNDLFVSIVTLQSHNLFWYLLWMWSCNLHKPAILGCVKSIEVTRPALNMFAFV